MGPIPFSIKSGSLKSGTVVLALRGEERVGGLLVSNKPGTLGRKGAGVHIFSKVLYTVILYRRCSRALTFENLCACNCQGASQGRRRAH